MTPRPTRLATTTRIALLAMLLALASNLVLLAFIHWRTTDDAMAELARQVAAEAAAYDPLLPTADRAALARAVALEAGGEDELVLAGLIAADGRRLAGTVAEGLSPAVLDRAGFQIVALAEPRGRSAEAGVIARRVAGGGWLVVGRTFGEGLALQRTLRRALLLAVALAVVLGAACGWVIARAVGRRVARIAAVADEVGAGDFARRVAVEGGADPFDRLGARINHMLDRIAGLMQELRLLTDSLAHDLRSPIGRLRARIEGALATDDEAERDRLLAGVMTETDALSRILATVMEIGRSEAGAARAQFAPLDPNALMAELAEMYEPLAEEAGVALTLAVERRGQRLNGHRQLLAQALGNLIENALKYGAAGGEVVLTVMAGTRLMLTVADRGPGIAPADRDAAVRRFGRLDAARTLPGAGLGLALVEAVAHLHGGRLVLADNAPGLVARLDLPAA